ncbi:hypothetical protein CDL15_Pgr017620 [Punica granatum]|uniref:Uncharacterized protein n=1 Tax=Punica granatum TaxID=22663 RepID=A0A218W7H7_PUNGR|nr:hypothetical protein CDL15_Pgr017620 [Punica granatum]
MLVHTTGSKLFNQIYADERKKRPNGSHSHPSLVFRIAHQHDGQPADEEFRKIIV